MSEILRLENISAGYGAVEALKNVSLSVRPGEIVTIIGANGAGKTTTLMCISGVVPLRKGTIHFCGQEMSQCPAHELVRRGLVQIPEGRKIFPRLTVIENLKMGAFLQPDKRHQADILDNIFSLFPVLKERLNQIGGTLSGGEQQMLAIGRALMSKPKLLLMDEPSMGIAPLLVAKIFETIKKLNDSGMTILLVEQNAHQALSIAHRGYVLETGEIVLEDDARRLAQNERVKEAYLGEGG